jgi:S-disulfanyl-L-cysteine oxidoreductase SoxD
MKTVMKTAMKTSFSILSLMLLFQGCVASAQPAKRSIASGVFTAAQAKSGESAYQAQCASCHGADLRSTDAEAPDLNEGIFKFGWKGKTVAEIFEQIRSTMPLDNPRSLDDQTYLDILSFIFNFNGAPSGNQKLGPDLPALRQIVIEPPK